MKVGDLVRYRKGHHPDVQASFLVVGKSSYNRLQLLKGKDETILVHPDWLEVVSEGR